MKEAETLARQLLEAWNRRDISGFMGLLHDDVTWYDPGMLKPPAVGKVAVRAFAESVLTAFPDFSYMVREPVCASEDGRRCILPWRITATHSGWLVPPGFAPTNQRAEFDGVDLLDCADGQIVRIETYFDAIPAAEQLLRLSLRPVSGGFAERAAVSVQRLRAAWLRRS